MTNKLHKVYSKTSYYDTFVTYYVGKMTYAKKYNNIRKHWSATKSFFKKFHHKYEDALNRFPLVDFFCYV